jgi:hypothetical protein
MRVDLWASLCRLLDMQRVHDWTVRVTNLDNNFTGHLVAVLIGATLFCLWLWLSRLRSATWSTMALAFTVFAITMLVLFKIDSAVPRGSGKVIAVTLTLYTLFAAVKIARQHGQSKRKFGWLFLILSFAYASIYTLWAFFRVDSLAVLILIGWVAMPLWVISTIVRGWLLKRKTG